MDPTPVTAGAVAVVDELDVLLGEAGRRGFRWQLFRTDRHGPEVLAGVFQRSGCVDVFVLNDAEHAHGYRTPAGPDSDMFSPRDVFWWYGASPVWTLRCLLTLPEPGHPDAPSTLAPAPPGSGIPGGRMPVQVRRRGHANQ